jgi:hypothetical protein
MTSAIGMNRALKGKYAQAGMASGCVCRISVRSYVLLPGGDLDECNRPVPPRRQIGAAHPTRLIPQRAPRHERPAAMRVSPVHSLCRCGVFFEIVWGHHPMNTSRMTKGPSPLQPAHTYRPSQKANSDLLKSWTRGGLREYLLCRRKKSGMVSAEARRSCTSPSKTITTPNIKSRRPPGATAFMPHCSLFGVGVLRLFPKPPWEISVVSRLLIPNGCCF